MQEKGTKDLSFKMRLDDEDRARLGALAEHFSAPAATVVRMLIKEKFLEVAGQLALPGAPPVPPEQVDLLWCWRNAPQKPLSEEVLFESMQETGHYPFKTWRGLPRLLSEAKSAGFLSKVGAAYALTPMGVAWVTREWRRRSSR